MLCSHPRRHQLFLFGFEKHLVVAFFQRFVVVWEKALGIFHTLFDLRKRAEVGGAFVHFLG